jgi:hypothetical protein
MHARRSCCHSAEPRPPRLWYRAAALWRAVHASTLQRLAVTALLPSGRAGHGQVPTTPLSRAIFTRARYLPCCAGPSRRYGSRRSHVDAAAATPSSPHVHARPLIAVVACFHLATLCHCGMCRASAARCQCRTVPSNALHVALSPA